MREPAGRTMLAIPTSRWRALLLMAEAEHRTPQQQLAALVERWWTNDPEVQQWQARAYEQWPEMRQPGWWRREDDDASHRV